MYKLALILVIFFTSILNAKDHYNFYLNQYPLICGHQDEVNKYIIDHKFTAVNISVGREGSNEDGSIVFLVTYYINQMNQTLAVTELPNSPEKCILFHTFNLRMNESLIGKDT